MQTGLIDTTSSATSTTTSTSKTATKTLDKNSFLMLLVAQLKNQDPTSSSSTDPNQMVQQMTSFSTLEQMQNMNTTLTSMQTQNGAIFEAQSSSLIGKQVRVTSSSMDLKSGAATVGINLGSAASTVSLTIKDSSGNTVATLDEGTMTSGSHVVSWNGKDSNGNTLADGTYSVSVSAKDSSGNVVTTNTSAFATVESVSFVDGSIMVTAGGKTYSISDITQISA
jgi:flagellar basal-body rod modification protein FlgD